MYEGQIPVTGYLNGGRRNKETCQSGMEQSAEEVKPLICADPLLNKAVMYIHEGLVSAWVAVVTTPHTYTHTGPHYTKYRINQWCFHYVTIVFGVKQLGLRSFFGSGATTGPKVFTLLSGD